MTTRIFRSIFLVACAVLLACVIVIMGIMYDYFTSVQESSLHSQALLAAQGVEGDGLDYFDGLEVTDRRLTWVAADGTVIFDTEADASQMENHSGREEIQQALATGSGSSRRTSATLAERTIYSAVRLDDGSILRIAATHYTVFTLLMGMLQPLLLLLVAAIILSFVLSRRVSKRVVEPLNRLDLDTPLENDAYEELSPLLTRIEQQHRQIKLQMEELDQRQSEFSAVTENMSEGLMLLSSKGVILSLNPAAAKLFSTDNRCLGQDILTVDRSLAMQKLISVAQGGAHSEAVMELDGGEYQLDASPVLSGSTVTGVCLLAFDVSEKQMLEQRRREFSANVSHELKTPLQSIMGSAELIENGLVKPDDMPRFVGRIRSEASRLVTLIDDIIRLSQLDEGGDLPREELSLAALAGDAVSALSSKADERRVAVSVEGDAQINGVRQLVYEIIYNLCDNAIKYNVDGGSVKIALSSTPASSTLTVSDTGVGIPREAQSRVFERFYRVDKSHSRETGGTGLGLSIVKHAALYHGAKINLESQPGKGTEISVAFPKR